MNSGIYQIRNLANNHFYIGSSVNLRKRKQHHFNNLKRRTHKNHYLQNAYNKYGEDQFVFEILEYCEKSETLTREQWYLDNYRPEYNISPTAENNFGTTRTEEMKAKISGENNPFFGKTHTEESRLKMSAALTGAKHPFFGKHRPEETKQKIIETTTGKPKSESHRLNIILSHIGKHLGSDNPNAKRVAQIDLETNEIIQIFDCIKDAAFSTGTNQSKITDVCRGRRKYTNGFGWQYLDNE